MEDAEKQQTDITEARIIKNGPLMIRGKFLLRESTGEIGEKNGEIYLCRCGKSSNKPFCDDTHKKVDFIG